MLWIPACFVIDSLNSDLLRGAMRLVYGSLELYLVVLLCLGVIGMRIVVWKGYKRLFDPELRHIVQETLCFGLPQDNVQDYSDASNLARRTGKTVPEIYDAIKRHSQQANRNPIGRASQHHLVIAAAPLPPEATLV